MALTAYLNAVTRLLQFPPAPTALYATADLTTWINTARGQLAAESQSVDAVINLAVTAQVTAFTSLSLPTSVKSILAVRNIWSGTAVLNKWPFEQFVRRFMNPGATGSNTTTDWAQYGEAVKGTFYVNPTPSSSSTLTFDCLCIPIDLVDDSTAELIPYPWTDAIPYFAAYLALLSAQAAMRQADADRMLDRYTFFVNRARRFANTGVLEDFDRQTGIHTPIMPAGVMMGGGPARAAT